MKVLGAGIFLSKLAQIDTDLCVKLISRAFGVGNFFIKRRKVITLGSTM